GLAAVIYTDTLQSVVILIGAVVLFGITWSEVGTWDNLVAMYSQAIPNKTLENSNYTCGFPRKDFMHIWRDPVKGDIPWTGAAFGLTLIGIWFWCSDQIIVQRSLSARNMNHSKAGAVFASYLKLTPLFLWIIPGMISRILYPDEIACPDPESCLQACGNPAGCSNIAYPLLVVRKMPEGLRGLMLAGFLAALMSTLSSIFNSATTLFTMDIWKRFRKRATQRELMIVSRVVVLVLVIFSILWIPVMESANGGQIWNYIQTLFSCVSPPWCAVFLLGIFWKRTTEPAVFWSLTIGFLLGIIRMVLELLYRGSACGVFKPDPRPAILKDVHFFHFAIILASVTAILTVTISLFTKPRPPQKLHRVTWWTRNDPEELEESDSDDNLEAEMKSEEVISAQPSRFKRYIYKWLCGYNDRPRQTLTLEDKLLMRKRMQDIGEDPCARTTSLVRLIL
ncbi:sodium/glucose cotransporter 5, partial [Biomphalaria pfeifferi]